MAQTAATQRFCDAHLERAGVAVPAVHFVGDQAFCEACFRGDGVFSREARVDLRRPRRSAHAPSHEAGEVATRREDDKLTSQDAKFATVPPPLGSADAARTQRTYRMPLSAAGVERRERRILRIRTEFGEKPPKRGDALSPREIEILKLLAEGFNSREVAEGLKISVRTVKFHVSRSLLKSGARDRTGLLLWWLKTRGAYPAPASLLPVYVARIEDNLEMLASAVRSRAARLKREQQLNCSAGRHAAELLRTFEALLKSLAADASEQCPEKPPSDRTSE